METLKKHRIYTNKFFVYGHRGVPALEKENTISSFEKAIELNYDGIELDTMITQDGYLVIRHNLNTKPRSSADKIPVSQIKYEDFLIKPPTLKVLHSSIIFTKPTRFEAT